MKKLVIVLALLLLFGIGFVLNAFFGNPISKMLAERASQSYVSENYSDMGYEVESVAYDFKFTQYYAHARVSGSEDSYFTVTLDMLGNVTGDDYGYRVEAHANVANRLALEYKSLVEAVIDSDSYPYKVSIGYGMLEFDAEIDAELLEGAVTRAELVNDGEYDVSELGATNGYIVLYVDSDTVDYSTAAKIITETADLLSGAGIKFAMLDFCLEYPAPADDYAQRPDGEIRIRNFKASDIYAEDLENRLIKAHEETQKYYDSIDKEKAITE